jgi:hypothetical protein
MKTFETLESAGDDKMVHLAIPVDEAHRRYHFIVLVEPVDGGQLVPPAHDWPPGFFENTAGRWVGEFERPPQGEVEKREEL